MSTLACQARNGVEDRSSALFEPPRGQNDKHLNYFSLGPDSQGQQSVARRVASNQGSDHEGSGLSRRWVAAQRSVSDGGAGA